MPFDHLKFDHVGIRVTDLDVAERFYAKLGFVRDPGEFSPKGKACGLVHPTGLRIHLIFNGRTADEGNVLNAECLYGGQRLHSGSSPVSAMGRSVPSRFDGADPGKAPSAAS